MIEIIAVVGNRNPFEKSVRRIQAILTQKLEHSDFGIVTGGDCGTDTIGMQFAIRHGLPLIVYEPSGYHNSEFCDYCRSQNNCKIIRTERGFTENVSLIINDCHSVIAGDFDNYNIVAFEKALKQNKKVYVCGEYVKGQYDKRIPSGLIYV